MPKPKNIEKTPCWDKIWVLSGDPCRIHIALDSLLENKNRIKRLAKNEESSVVESLLRTYSIIPPVIIINEPSADILHICLSAVEDNCIVADSLIIIVAGDNIDGRISFYSKAQKNNKLINYSYIERGNQQSLLNHIKDWQSGSEVEISEKAMGWLINNSPVIVEKIKSSTGKKDTEVYDLSLLESELDKIASLARYENRPIEYEEVITFCDFNQVSDIWEFIKAAISGNYSLSSKLLYKMIDQEGVNGILWLLNSQLAFLIQLKDLLNQGINSVSVLQEKMNYKEYLNKYVDTNWQEVNGINEPNINTGRIYKALESIHGWNINRLVQQQEAISKAIVDMRSGGKEDIVMPFLLLSLSGVAKYQNYLYHAE